MKNFKIYMITIFLSLLMLVTPYLSESTFSTIISGIGCSGIAAAVMAIFLERASEIKEKERVNRAKALYFRQLNDQLTMIIERLLWFEERIDEDKFDWDLDESIYASFKYMVAMSTIYPDKTISYDEGIERLKAIGTKYNLEGIRELPENTKLKVQKMFKIIAVNSQYLINEANIIEKDKLILEIEDYLSMDDNKNIIFNISFAIGLMNKNDKNYEAMIKSLIQASEKIRKIGGYTNDFRVGMHGSFPISEL